MHIQINTHVNTYTKSANIGKYIYTQNAYTQYKYTQIRIYTDTFTQKIHLQTHIHKFIHTNTYIKHRIHINANTQNTYT